MRCFTRDFFGGGKENSFLKVLPIRKRKISSIFISLPTFLTLSVNYLLLTLTILTNTDRSGTLINQLFPNFRGIRNRGRDVWQIPELNPIVFWYMTGETPEMAEAMVEKVYLDVTAPRHLPRTPRTKTGDVAAFSTLAIASFWS